MKKPKPPAAAAAPPLTTDEQIDHIMQLMVLREWRPGRSHRELAEAWGIKPRTVTDRAIVASAILSRAGGPLAEWTERKMYELEEIQAQALAKKRSTVTKEGELVEWEEPDFHSAVSAIRTQLEVKGALSRRELKRGEPEESKAPAKDLVKAMLADDDMRREVLEQLEQAKGEVH